MKRFCAMVLAGLLWLPAVLQAGALPPALEGTPMPSLAPMLQRVMPGVVNIATRGKVESRENPLLNDPLFRFFFDLPRNKPRKKEFQSLGSGVVVDAGEGLILTNHHVIEQADRIQVTLHDGRALAAKLVGVDEETDVAVIRVEEKGLTPLALGDSDRMRVGDFVVAIGNPFGLGQTVTSGIVSALGRGGLGIEGYEDFIQTDASINPGNSGGALVNLRGELIGINTAILAPNGGNVGIGFAIPTNMARMIMRQLVAHGEVRRGRLGVATQDLTPELAKAFAISVQEGAVVTRVSPEQSAERAGLQAGDVIVSANGRPVDGSARLRTVVGLAEVGSTLTLSILREGKSLTVPIRIEEPKRETADAGALDERLRGALLESLEGEGPGLRLVQVERGSSAWGIGLREEDRLIAVNGVVVNRVDDLSGAVKRDRRKLLLTLLRGDQELSILLR